MSHDTSVCDNTDDGMNTKFDTEGNTDNQSFEYLDPSKVTQIRNDDINSLLEFFANYTYNTSSHQGNCILERCISLLKLDYSLMMVQNNGGDLCHQYPNDLPICMYENCNNSGQTSQRTTDTIYESIYDVQTLRELFLKAKFARCRSRFAMPVILYKGKYICRSSTISDIPEIYGRFGLEYLFWGISGLGSKPKVEGEVVDDIACIKETIPSLLTLSMKHVCDEVRSDDIELLKNLNVGTIVDLMVENRKVKFGFYVTSSEKVDRENRYSDFNIISIPYPGCEFFKEFRDNHLDAEGLYFDWTQKHCDAELNIPDNPLLAQLKIDWNDYKNWDLVLLTQNYMRYLLKYYQDNTSGILIHCISGWDRTPLYISLIRLSLWADGLIHQSLDEHQILYLTIAYDWMLFGHQLLNRLGKGENIFLFCFYMLKHLTGQEFSIAPGRQKRKLTDRVADESMYRAESEPNIEILLEGDHRGSNVSLNSICSTISNKSQHYDEPNGKSGSSLDVQDLPLGASTSPKMKRTSPITVPMGPRMKRTDSPSASSVHSNHSIQSNTSTDSWQVVTTTGSLKGSDSSIGDLSFSNASMCTVLDGDELSQEGPVSPLPCRKERLTKVRDNFYKMYFQAVGSKYIEFGSDSSVGTLLGGLAEKVGFSLNSKSVQK